MVGLVSYGGIVKLVVHLGTDPRPLFDQWSGSRVIILHYQVGSVAL